MSKTVTIYRGKILDLHRETCELPDGRQGDFEIVRHPGGAAVLPILPNGALLLIRQFRPATAGTIIEIPAGRLDAGETSEQCAARELLEETGWQAGRVVTLGTVYSTPGFCDEKIHLFLADQLAPGCVNRETDEFIDLFEVELPTALALIEQGGIPDSKTQLAILRYAQKLQILSD